MYPAITIIHKLCDTACVRGSLSLRRVGRHAVRRLKSPIESGDIALVRTSADFQLPAYAIYKPMQTVSDPALEYLENSMLHVASSLEEAQQTASP